MQSMWLCFSELLPVTNVFHTVSPFLPLSLSLLSPPSAPLLLHLILCVCSSAVQFSSTCPQLPTVICVLSLWGAHHQFLCPFLTAKYCPFISLFKSLFFTYIFDECFTHCFPFFFLFLTDGSTVYDFMSGFFSVIFFPFVSLGIKCAKATL